MGDVQGRKSSDWELRGFWEQHGEKRGVPKGVQNLLNAAFTKVPVSSFTELPCGRVVEIRGDVSISEAVHILAEHSIFSAPVTNPNASATDAWPTRYLGMVDYPAVIIWVLEQAEIVAGANAASSAAAVGMGAGTVGALGAIAMGVTGPVAMAGIAAAAVGTAIAVMQSPLTEEQKKEKYCGLISEGTVGKNAPTATNALQEDFYKVILRKEPFKSTKVSEITKAYRWAPFLPIQLDDSMLTVLLLLSKFRLRSIPVVCHSDPTVKNVITQSAIIRGLSQCQGRDWFDSLAGKSLHQLGLPVMPPDKVVSVDAERLVLEAFVLMKDMGVGGLPVVEGPKKELKGNISVRDVRFLLLQPDLFARRQQLTVVEFMKTVKWVAPAQCGMVPALTCEETAKLGHVIELLSAQNFHRIYIVDKNSQLQGVVTLRDIIGCFVSEPQGYFDDYFGGTFKETLMNSIYRVPIRHFAAEM